MSDRFVASVRMRRDDSLLATCGMEAAGGVARGPDSVRTRHAARQLRITDEIGIMAGDILICFRENTHGRS
jgi:hypothetical protein